MNDDISDDPVFTVELHLHKHVPIDITVENLCYTVSDKPVKLWQRLVALQMPCEWTKTVEMKQVLDSVSFTVKSGKMLAIMGSSGSGKTSLLDVLACKTLTGKVTGDVLFNGVARTRSMIDVCCAYVRQDDRLLANLTVRETLMFVAELKLPTTFTKQKIKYRVQSVIAELGLSHVADTKVGNSEIRGISGGERRRVSIGIQLLVDPSILFLDEPTSGLDSFTAHHLVQTLAKLAGRQRTVLLSIHQPRSDIFELFDLVLLMSGGRTVYFGEARNMVQYFSNLGFPCPQQTNPSDFYVDLSTIDVTTEATEKRSAKTTYSLVKAYQRYLQNTTPEPDYDDDYEKYPPLTAAFRNAKYQPGVVRQFRVLFRRSLRNLVEDYWLLLILLFQSVSMSFVQALVFLDLKLDQTSIRDRFGMLFITLMMYPYMMVLDIIGQCHKERKFLYFEMQDKLYSAGPFYFSKILSELPFHTVYVTCFIVPQYFLAGLQNDSEVFFTIFGIIFLSVYCSRCMAMLAASLMPNYQISVVLAQSLSTVYFLSAGYLINIDNILPAFRWISTISFFRWGFEGLSIAEMTGLNFTCQHNVPSLCIPTGKKALQLYAFDDGTIWLACTGILVSIVVYLTLFFIGLKFVPQKPHEH